MDTPISILLIIAVSLTPLLCATAETQPDTTSNPLPNIIPSPEQWSGRLGYFDISSAVLTVPHTQLSTLKPILNIFRQDLLTANITKTEISSPSRRNPPKNRKNISFAITPIDGEFNHEQYTLVIEPERIAVTAPTATGIFYATQSLLQMAIQSPKLPCGTITDAPAYRKRALMIDVGRKFFPYETLKDYIRVLGFLKMNELHLHISDNSFGKELYPGFRIECETMPELTSKDGYYTKKQIRELQDFAILRGVVITPEIDAPGHAFCFTHLRPELRHPKLGDSYLDVTNPETIKLMKSIFDEFIPLFKSSDVHIGTDEYRRGAANKEEWAILGESFRKYINIMNRYIRDKHGKTVRIWSGWEHMPGVTQPDTNIVIDMWVSSDAVSKSNAGYKYINSNHGRTYIVPGAGYYGVNNVALYNKWTPAVFTGNKKKDPSPDDPNLLGAKLHIWNDMGPSGYTMYEIADLAMPTLFVMSEKMWGTKASANYDEFTVRAAKLKNIPDVRLLQREVNAIDREKGIIFDSGDTVYTLTTPDESIPLMKYLCDTGDEHKNLEFPWTISMQIKPADGVEQIAPATILSSRIAELQADFRFTTSSRNRKTKVVTKTNHSGLGLERLNKYTSKPLRCSSSQSSRAASSVQLPNGRFSTLTCVGMRRATKIYLDGKQIAEFTGRRSQFICPLETVGTYPGRGKGFVGEIKFLKIYNRALDKNAIDKLVKLKLSVNIARNARVKVSQSDTAHNLTPEKMLDGNTYARSSRWSSGKTKTPASVILDLGKPRTINEIRLYWESAYPKNYSVEISADGKNFRAISTTRGKPGLATVKIPPANARFIRVNMENPATQWGYSLYEIEILGE